MKEVDFVDFGGVELAVLKKGCWRNIAIALIDWL
jgi:hypothetical protein